MSDKEPGARRLDLLGTGCPMNLVYLKVELARMETGQLIGVLLDDGAPVRNVVQSVEREGHQLLHREQLADGSWEVIIRKG